MANKISKSALIARSAFLIISIMIVFGLLESVDAGLKSTLVIIFILIAALLLNRKIDDELIPKN